MTEGQSSDGDDDPIQEQLNSSSGGTDTIHFGLNETKI